MVRKNSRKGDFRAAGHFQIRMPTGEIVRVYGKEEPPFKLTVSTDNVLQARREVLEWASGLARYLTGSRYSKALILNIRVEQKGAQKRTQLPLFSGF